MPVARFEMPDGRVARFEVPDGTTPEQAHSMMEAHFGAAAESPSPVPPAANKPSFAEEATRQVGLLNRGLAQGLMGVPIMAADKIVSDINSGIAGANKFIGAGRALIQGRDLTKQEQNAPSQVIPSIGSPQAGFNKIIDAYTPQPANALERITNRGVSALASPGSGIGAALMARGIPAVAKQAAVSGIRPNLQAISTLTGSAASGIAQESGAGSMGQAAAGVVGSVAPGMGSLASGLTKNLLRGGDENIPAMRQTIRQFERAGTTPSVGQATGKRFPQAIESMAAKTPGGAGPMAAFSEKQAADIGIKAEQIADGITPGADAFTAGRAIEKGISGDGGFINRFKQMQSHLYGKLDLYVKPQTKMSVDNTRTALAQLNSDIDSAPALSEWFKNNRIEALEKSLLSDIGKPQTQITREVLSPYTGKRSIEIVQPEIPAGSALPYEAVKKMRSLVGAQLDNPSLSDDVGRSKWKALYAALSRDMESAIDSAGDPDASKAFSRANSFTKAGHSRIDETLQTIADRNYPEKIYQAATSDLRAGPSKIAAIMHSLSPAERDTIRSAFIRNMGQAKDGAQNAAGDVFSTQTFLTNWNKINPRAKTVLFSEIPGLRDDLNSIAGVSENIKTGSKVFANPSGTAQSNALIAMGGVGGSALTATLTGNPLVAGGILAGAGATAVLSNYTAKKMTDPRFVNRLMQPTAATAPSLKGSVPTLQQIMSDKRNQK